MPVELISATHVTPAPSAHGHDLAGFDPDHTQRFARMLDDGEFDYTLIACSSGAPDSLQLAQIHIISGGSDAEQRREGDYTTKEQRYRRSEEFVNVLRDVWTADGPMPLVRQELARRAATGRSPVLNPDSKPAVAAA